MKQIQEKYLVLTAALFALLIGGYTVYTVTKIVAQTTSDDGYNIDASTSSTTIIKDDPEPEPIPPEPDPTFEEDPVVKDPYIPEDENRNPVYDEKATETTTSDTDDSVSTDTTKVYPTDTTDEQIYTKDPIYDTEDTKTTSDDETVYKTEDVIYASPTTETSDTTVDYKPDDPTYTTKIDENIVKEQENPYIDFSTATADVNVKEYIEKFVPREEVEKVFTKEEYQMTAEEREKLERIKKEAVLDSDADGIPDYEENRLGTNIFVADTDGDGYKDGDEVKNGYDPRKFSAGDGSDKIEFDDPETVKEASKVFVIDKIVPKDKMPEDEKEDEKGEEFQISGKGLPNSIITLYIYSDPIVVTVQADNDGSWYYVLDKELEEGEHKVYAAVTDSTGKVTARSEGMTFVKTAKALDEAEIATSELQTQMVSPVRRAQSNMTKIGLAIAVVSVILAILSIGYFVKTKGRHESNMKKGDSNSGPRNTPPAPPSPPKQV